jgi:pectate lyase
MAAMFPRLGRKTSLILTVGICLVFVGTATAATGPRQYLRQSDRWFAGEEAQRIAAHVLSYQSSLGGWPKNVDTTAAPFTGDRASLKPTFDNDATTDELRFLARIYGATRQDRYREAFLKGLDYILKAQYPSGGWPQVFPPGTSYHRHITFNDNAMVRLMQFLREVDRSPTYSFVDTDRRQAARQAFDRGIQCILKCQIKVNGKLTAWCAQHDEKDYRPRPGRSYELVSLSGAESVGVVRLLMSLDNPAPDVVQAVEGAVAWFEAAKLKGIRVVEQKDDRAPTGRNKVVVADPAAPPLWARFYDIPTNRPIFADRDGVPKPNLADIGYERRNGYAWLGTWPEKLLSQEYPAWKQQRAGQSTRARVRIVLAGDSTVIDKGGWGAAFARRLGPDAECVNLARSGRSSKSYRNEGLWKKALEQKPDYILIQFGHNDMPGKGPERETDPKTTYRENLARYVDEARAIGATPILVTPMTRRAFTKEGKIQSDLVPYAEAVKQIAADKKVPLVDLHARSIEYLNQIGPDAAAALNPVSKDPARTDRTHLSEKGGEVMAGLVVGDLRKAEPRLAKYLK